MQPLKYLFKRNILEWFEVKFKSYNSIVKNRTDRRGDGVALLIHKFIPYTPINFPTSPTLEVTGATIMLNDHNKFDLLSVYSPQGNFSKEDFTTLIDRENSFVVCGDFNAHHTLWESHSTANRGGTSIFESLLDHP